jgi:hypothetical protein
LWGFFVLKRYEINVYSWSLSIVKNIWPQEVLPFFLVDIEAF